LFVEYFTDICIITEAAGVVINIGNIDDNNKQVISHTIQLKRLIIYVKNVYHFISISSDKVKYKWTSNILAEYNLGNGFVHVLLKDVQKKINDSDKQTF
jgi:hypothetical protein